MKLSLQILCAALSVLVVPEVVRAQYEDVCPSTTAIAPCTCDREGVNCNQVKTIDQLRKAFQAVMTPPVLRAIWVQDTPLTTLPRGIFGSYQISQFNLDSNDLTTVESGAFSSSEFIVTLLSLYDNRLVQFPFDDLPRMVNLQALNLAKNRLTAVPDYAFGPHGSLSAILLTDNRISTIGRFAFHGLSNLQMLDLSGNTLTILGPSALEMNGHHPFLQISLFNNSISSINPSAFRGVEPAVVSLEFNKLTSLPETVFGPMINSVLQKQGVIALYGNPLSCRGCDYLWIAMNKFTLQYALHGFVCTNGMQITELTLMNIGCSSV